MTGVGGGGSHDIGYFLNSTCDIDTFKLINIYWKIATGNIAISKIQNVMILGTPIKGPSIRKTACLPKYTNESVTYRFSLHYRQKHFTIPTSSIQFSFSNSNFLNKVLVIL